MKKFISCSLFLFASGVSMADSLYAVPTSWRLENYIGGNVVAWYTDSPCTSGKLTLPSNASADDKNRFWSVVMAGKVGGKRVFVYFDDTSPNCNIVSFGMDKEI